MWGNPRVYEDGLCTAVERASGHQGDKDTKSNREQPHTTLSTLNSHTTWAKKPHKVVESSIRE
jgi:hypothetical protein